MRVDHMGHGKVEGAKQNAMFCHTYNITNLRGLRERTGNRVKHMTKQAKAARLQAPKTINRSHRLTAIHQVSQAALTP